MKRLLIALLCAVTVIQVTSAADPLGWLVYKMTGNYAYICGKNLTYAEKKAMRLNDNHHPQTDVFAAKNAEQAARNCARDDLYKVRSNGALSKK